MSRFDAEAEEGALRGGLERIDFDHANVMTPSSSLGHLSDHEGEPSTGLQLELPKSSSRNSIFSATSPVMKPAPRLPSVFDRSGRSTRDASYSNSPTTQAPTRRGLLFANTASQSGNASPITPLPPASTEVRFTSAERPGYGRLNKQEREQERERIRRTNEQISFRLCPTRDFLLGEGRHSNVYLGSYRCRTGQGGIENDTNRAAHEWTLCAVKRPHADHQSQLFALEEAFALRKLGSHPNVVQLISIRDEAGLSRAGTDSHEIAGSVLGNSPPPHPPTSHYMRAISDTYSMGKDPVSANPQHRLVSQPAALHGDEYHGMGADPARGSVTGGSSTQGDLAQNPDDTARLVMLLELLPFSLSTFVRRNAEMIDVQQWHSWALELARVVEWIHSRGCIHADLKPENILLTADLHIKLCDFNSAVFPSPTTPLLDGLGLGTPAYGAPELSRGVQQRGGEVKGFHFPVDIWSLGAILYSLASGVEPFRRARSMIDMLYRKRVFFESEENDRIANMSVAEGSSTVGVLSRTGQVGFDSQPASRSGSLKGRKRAGTTSGNSPISTRPYSASHHRAASSESGSSVASSVVLTGNGNRPIASKIDVLLADETPTGLLLHHDAHHHASVHARVAHGSLHPPQDAQTPLKKTMRISHTYGAVNGHHRASSLGKVQGNHLRPSSQHVISNEAKPQAEEPRTVPTRIINLPDGSQHLQPLQVHPLRPETIRRTTSYTGQTHSDDATGQARTNGNRTLDQNPRHDEMDENRGNLHLAVAAAFATSKSTLPTRDADVDRRPSDGSTFSFTSFYGFGDRAGSPTEPEEEQDLRPYTDGAPALILPGGGRLPDEARNLLESMLNVDPDRRPTAMEVRIALEAMAV